MAAARIRNDSWKEDSNLREKPKDFVTEGLRREEILDFMFRDLDCYAWSVRTLDSILDTWIQDSRTPTSQWMRSRKQ